jgi:hypothetical protein
MDVMHKRLQDVAPDIAVLTEAQKAKKVENLVLAAEAYTSLGPFLSLGISDLGDVISQFVGSIQGYVVKIVDGI